MMNEKNYKKFITENINNIIFSENINVSEKDNKIMARGLLMPKDKISRNGILYDWDSVKNSFHKFIGKSSMYNHAIETREKPIGHVSDIKFFEKRPVDKIWKEIWDETTSKNYGVEQPGVYYEINVNKNSEYADSIVRGDIPNVSLQIIPETQSRENDDNGNSYTRAFVKSPLEISFVPAGGFEETTIQVALAEAFNRNIKTYKKESVENLGILKKDGTGPNPDCGKKEYIEPAKEEDVDKHQLELGIVVEMEHTNDKEEAKKIALQHLAEIPDYYTRLNKMEDEAKKEEGIDTSNIPTATKLSQLDEKEGCDKKENDDEAKIIEELSDEDAKNMKQELEEESIMDAKEKLKELFNKVKEENKMLKEELVTKKEYQEDMNKVVSIMEKLKEQIEEEEPKEEAMDEEEPEVVEGVTEETEEPKKEEIEAKPEEEPKKEEVEAKPEEEPKKEEIEAKPEEEPKKEEVESPQDKDAVAPKEEAVEEEPKKEQEIPIEEPKKEEEEEPTPPIEEKLSLNMLTQTKRENLHKNLKGLF